MEGHDAAEDGFALIASCVVLRDDAGSDLDLLSEAQDTREDGAAGDTAFEIIDLRTRFVHIERADDDEAGIGGEVADGNGDAFDDVLVDCVDVVFQLRGYGDDGGGFGDGSCRGGSTRGERGADTTDL